MLMSYIFSIEHIFNSNIAQQHSCIDAHCFSQNITAAVEKGAL